MKSMIFNSAITILIIFAFDISKIDAMGFSATIGGGISSVYGEWNATEYPNSKYQEVENGRTVSEMFQFSNSLILTNLLDFTYGIDLAYIPRVGIHIVDNAGRINQNVSTQITQYGMSACLSLHLPNYWSDDSGDSPKVSLGFYGGGRSINSGVQHYLSNTRSMGNEYYGVIGEIGFLHMIKNKYHIEYLIFHRSDLCDYPVNATGIAFRYYFGSLSENK
jgi:hypothetical protein